MADVLGDALERLWRVIESRRGADPATSYTAKLFGRGKAKILGEPRSRTRAVEWMTATLVERFDAADGGRLYCKTCHVGQLGDAGFQPRVILTDHLPPLPPSTGPAAASGAVDAGDGAN